jgi:branched-chain amino acid transport system permease protein
MAQGCVYGIGSYSTALILKNTDVNFITALVGAVGINILASLPIIFFSIRLKDLYFSLASLSWQIIVFSLMLNCQSITNGPLGITGINKPEIGGFIFSSILQFSILSTITTLSVLLFFIILHRTPLSRLFLAMRDDHLVIISLGKNPKYYKACSILIATITTSIAGSLFATYYTYIDPTSFTLDESIMVISIVLIGGLASIKGSVLGAIFIVILPEILRFIELPHSSASNLRMIIYSMILVFVILFKPYGLAGKYKFK